MADVPEDPPPTEGYLYELCKREGQLRLLFLLTAAGVGLMALWLAVALSVPSLAGGIGGYVVATMSLIAAGGLSGGSLYLIRRCVRRKERRREAYRVSRERE